MWDRVNYSRRLLGLPFRIPGKWLVLIAGIFLSAVITHGQDQYSNDENYGVGRISLIHNSVLLKRGDADDWYDAALNTPVQTGDRVYTGADSRAELEFDGNIYRLNYNSGFDVLDLSGSRSQFSLYEGTLTIYLRYLPAQPIEIDVPSAAITISKLGLYRIDAFESGGMKMVVWEGSAEVYNGTSFPLYAGQQMVLNGNNYDLAGLDPTDEWDNWNIALNEKLDKAEQCRRYVADYQSVNGVEELDAYGQWNDIPDYGWAWTPAAVPVGWAPYRQGRWIWRDPYGWTWVSREPWGWAPYHYGRWVFVTGRWYWAPGSYRRYSPALVGFISYNNGAYIGWVPLAPRDEFVPWWGRHRRTGTTTIVYINQNYTSSITLTTSNGLAAGEVRHRQIVTDGRFNYAGGHPIDVVPVVPTRRGLAPAREQPVTPSPALTGVFGRPVVHRNTDVPEVRPFSEKLVEIKQQQGAPVSDLRRDEKGSPVFRTISPPSRGNSAAGTPPASAPSLVRQPGLIQSFGGRPATTNAGNNGSARQQSGGAVQQTPGAGQAPVNPFSRQNPPSQGQGQRTPENPSQREPSPNNQPAAGQGTQNPPSPKEPAVQGEERRLPLFTPPRPSGGGQSSGQVKPPQRSTQPQAQPSKGREPRNPWIQQPGASKGTPSQNAGQVKERRQAAPKQLPQKAPARQPQQNPPRQEKKENPPPKKDNNGPPPRGIF